MFRKLNVPSLILLKKSVIDDVINNLNSQLPIKELELVKTKDQKNRILLKERLIGIVLLNYQNQVSRQEADIAHLTAELTYR